MQGFHAVHFVMAEKNRLVADVFHFADVLPIDKVEMGGIPFFVFPFLKDAQQVAVVQVEAPQAAGLFGLLKAAPEFHFLMGDARPGLMAFDFFLRVNPGFDFLQAVVGILSVNANKALLAGWL